MRERLTCEQRAALYFSESEEVRVRYCPILFRSAPGPSNSTMSIDRLVQELRGGKRQSPLILTVDFVLDLKETLWALATRVAPTCDPGQQGLAAHWISGTSILNNFSSDARRRWRPELLILDEVNGQDLSERAQAEQLESSLSGGPLLFIADFSDLGSLHRRAWEAEETIGVALAALEGFAHTAASKGHRTLIGFPRVCQASDSVRRFINISELSYFSAELFAPGQDFRVHRLHEKFGVELEEPLRTLLSCNSNAVGYTVLAFFLEQGGLGWRPKSDAELLALAAWLFQRGFHEIAFRLEVHTRQATQGQKVVALSFDVERAEDSGMDSVVGVVDDPKDLPCSVRWGALVGEGGSGKTTTLLEIERQWSLPTVIGEGERRASWLPVYLSVAALEGSLWERLAQSWREGAAKVPGGGLPWSDLGECTKNGNLPGSSRFCVGAA